MARIDPEQERERLAARYAAMSDLELKEVAEDPASLTEGALKALEQEMSRRGLQRQVVIDEKSPDTLPERPVILRRYRDMPQAFVEKSVLEGAGIICCLQDDNVIRMDWLWSNAMGGIKLLVRESDAQEAERILSEAQSARGEGDETRS